MTTGTRRARSPPRAGPTNHSHLLDPAEHIEYFCLVCGKKTNEHDPEEYADCGEAFRRWLPVLHGEGYIEVPSSDGGGSA